MKLSEAKNYLPFIKAAIDGKTIQRLDNGVWWDCDPHASKVSFNDPADCYRIKPTPTFRAWKPEEVPVGALFKWGKHISLILAVAGDKLIYINEAGNVSYNYLTIGCLESHCSHSIDNGETWLHCGVMEEEK